jgi:hypothetical protein
MPGRFRDGCLNPLSHGSVAVRARFELADVVRRPISSRLPYSHSGPPHLDHCVPREGFEPSRPSGHTDLNRARLHFTTGAWTSPYRASSQQARAGEIGADSRARTGGLHHGKVARCQLRYARMIFEPPGGCEPPAFSVPGRCSALSYGGMVPGAGLEPACTRAKTASGCQQPTPDR